MAHQRPGRKKRDRQHRPAEYNPRHRAVRRRVGREKKKKGQAECKEIFLVIGGMVLATIGIILLYNFLTAHDEMMHHH